MTDSIDSIELNRLLNDAQTPLVLDVRRQADYMTDPWRIATAAWRDPEAIDRWIEELPRGRACVVYCVKGGAVSQSVAARMRQKGYAAQFLAGGLKAWREGGNPVESLRGAGAATDEPESAP
jgi:rhodanese-related sulfurtransferase